MVYRDSTIVINVGSIADSDANSSYSDACAAGANIDTYTTTFTRVPRSPGIICRRIPVRV